MSLSSEPKDKGLDAEAEERILSNYAEVGPPPDGGLWAWLQVIVMFFGTWNSWGVVNAFGVFQEYYGTNILTGTSAGTISWVGTVAGALILFGAIFVGPLIDLGYVKHMVLISALLQSFSFMMLSLSTKYYQILLTQGICSGIASSMAFVCGVSCVGTWFDRRRSMAVGFGATGSAFGGVVYSILSRQALKRVGFAWTARILGFVMLGTQLIAFTFCRRRLPPRKTGSFFDYRAFTEVSMSTLAWSLLLANAGAYIFYFYAQSYAITEIPNSNYNLMVYTSAILNSGSVPGRLLPNFAAQYWGPVTVYTLAVGVTALLCWFWLLAKSEAAILIIAWLVGFSTGPVVSLPAPAVAMLTPDLSRLGTRLAFVYTFGGVGMLIGPPMGGIIIRSYAWKYGIIYAGCLATMGLCFCVFCRQYLTEGAIRGRV